MADSVRTKIRKAFKARLETIDGTAGYLTKVKKVNTEDVSVESMSGSFPVINIVLGSEEIVSARDSTGIMEKKLNVFLDCYLQDAATLQDSVDRLVQDIEKCLIGNVAGYGLNGTCSELYPVSIQPFYLDCQQPNGAVTIAMHVFYSQKLTDPTTQGHL